MWRPTPGCTLSPILWLVSSCSQRTDMGVWTDMLADWARSLQSPDVEDPKSSAYRRIETLGQLVLRGMRLKVCSCCIWTAVDAGPAGNLADNTIPERRLLTCLH